MSPFARELFRRIALGLPIAAVVPGTALALTLTACPCPGAGPSRRYSITEAELASITTSSGTIDLVACRDLCAAIADGAPLGPADAGPIADAGPRDAGAFPSSRSSQWASCTLEDDGHTLLCIPAAPACIGGRAPAGLEPVASPRSVGEHLARSAWFEAGSIEAFLDVAADLQALGAPRSLVQRAVAAAHDEARHAALYAALARTHGVTPPPVIRSRAARRGIDELVLDNTVEGLGREAFAALVAAHQRDHAVDPRLRAVAAGVAADEARHALLSADLDAWLAPHASPAARLAAVALRRTLVDELARGAEDEPLRTTLGLPSPETAVSFAAALA